MLEFFLIFTFKTSYDFFNFLNSIRAHVGNTAFATLQMELYRVVDYDSKWSTKFHNDCMLEFFFNFTFKTSYDNFFNFQNSNRVHVRHSAFATLQIELYRVVDYDSKWSTKFQKDCMLGIFIISLLRRLLILKSNYQNVWPTAFATVHNELDHAVNYHSK